MRQELELVAGAPDFIVIVVPTAVALAVIGYLTHRTIVRKRPPK
jgi:hypothetical protein